ncbi:MAG: hypothetical protein ACYS5V_11460 [Planctomycetota bacterium]
MDAPARDPQRLVGQDNLRCYRPVPALRVRVHPDDDAFEIFARVAAARTVPLPSSVNKPRTKLQRRSPSLTPRLREVAAAS